MRGERSNVPRDSAALYGAEELHFDNFCVNWTQEPNVIFMPENKILLLSKCVERWFAEKL